MSLRIAIVLFALAGASACGGDEGCGEGTTKCAGTCRDLAVDPSNCGACGQACADNEACVDAVCTPCAGGMIVCDGVCTDLQTDVASCGECGHACEVTEVCFDGACGVSCGGLDECDGGCHDLTSDPAHCGECGNACQAHEACVAGACGCPAGLESCADGCFDFATDDTHCGGCETECDQAQYSCIDGTCVYDVVGVAFDMTPDDLVGWTECFSGYYDGTQSFDTILAACDGAHLLLGCMRSFDDELQILAHAPREDVLYDTGTGNEPHVANGVAWYYSDDWSWGFAREGDALDRNSCDIGTTHADERLCWQTAEGALSGGYRCGRNDDVFDAIFIRVIYERD